MKSILGGLIFAALAAGSGSLPAVSAQQSSQNGATPASAKKSSSSPAAASSSTHKSTKSSKSARTKSSSRRKAKKVRGQEAPTSERINEIQSALARKGAYTGTPTGQWDDTTVDAMKTFQAKNGLSPSGKLDALTLQKLGLGSETAGLAPPTPPPNSINRLRNTSSLPEEPHDP